MKHLAVLLFFVLCSLSAYGQQNSDLIVTVSGDSIQCRIIDVGVNVIQFRYGAGNIISIRRNEVATFEYNFFSRSQTLASSRVETRKLPSFYLAANAGVGAFGSISFSDDAEGFALIIGVDAGYFLNSWLGAGLKINAMHAKVDLDEKFTYDDMAMLFGPALYGSFGKNNLKLNLCIAGGGLLWTMFNQSYDGYSIDDSKAVSVGGFFSAGIGYNFTRNTGVGLNLQSMIGKLEDEDRSLERNLLALGYTFGINFRF